MRPGRILLAEALGTFILMMGGPGTAVLAGADVAQLGIALGFGFALLVAAYTVGPISGCHINPAVTVGMAVMRKTPTALVPAYIVGQVLGAVAGGFAIWGLRAGFYDDFEPDSLNFATNLWGEQNGFANFGAMMIAEIVLTAILMIVVLATTKKSFAPAAAGLSVGMALTLIHLVSIPVDNTSVNPARSLGMAVFTGGEALEQLWAFVVFPIVGAVFGVLVWLAIDDATLEDTVLGDTALTGARDALSEVSGRVDAAMGADPIDLTGTETPAPQALVGAVVGQAQPFGPGSHHAHPDQPAPTGYVIKGNATSMLYHRPDSRNYVATVAEVWFVSEDVARAAGFRPSPTHSDG